MIESIRYSSEYKSQWDNLIKRSRNGTFLFYRDYMDYHADRFKDCSFLFFKKRKLEAVIPGNIDNQCYYSHQGLTYGGIISSSKINTKDIIEIFNSINKDLKKIGVNTIYYKPIPLIYHKVPAQEDIYALFLNKAEKIGCNISSAIIQQNKISFSESRKSGIRKSLKEEIQISIDNDYDAFWEILSSNLVNKYNKKPVHSYHEIKLLSNRFPDNIKLYIAKNKGDIIAGSVLYLTKNTVHVQYIASNRIGKEKGALDLLFDYLINKEFSEIPIFDFGQSTEKMGKDLNENLIFQKEGFGGRGIVYDIYKYSI